MNIIVSIDKSERLHFNLLLLSIVYKVSATKLQINYLLWLRDKMDSFLENDIRNLVNFNANSAKSENLHLAELLLYKIYNVWA